jgi:hypothetical protein
LDIVLAQVCVGIMGRVLEQVCQEDGLGKGGADVFPRTAVAVSAGSDFEVEAGRKRRTSELVLMFVAVPPFERGSPKPTCS